MTDEEYAQLEGLAQARGLTLGEWCREVLLAQLAPSSATLPEKAILTEILGLRMIAINDRDAHFSGTSRFVIKERLGEGTFGIVYRVLDRELNSMVALKILRRMDATHLFRFKHEFRSLVDLIHPNLVQIYELFGDDKVWFFTMELVEGVDFLSYTRPRDVIASWDRIRETLAQLTAGVQALHSAACLHRDLKPSNVLVSNTGQVLILGFPGW